MRKIVSYFMMICVLLLCFCGCSKKEAETKNDQTEKDDRTVITWVVASSAKKYSNNIDYLNTLLKERGCDYKLDVVYERVDDYSENVKKYVESGKTCDIITLGATTVFNDALNMLQDEYLMDLTDIISNYEVFEKIDEKAWKQTVYNGKNYLIPNMLRWTETDLYIAFNPDYVTKEQVDKYDGTMGMLLDMYELYALTDTKIYINNDAATSMILNMAENGMEYKYGVMFMKNGEKTLSVNECQAVYDMYDRMNKHYLEENIVKTETSKMDNDDWFAKVIYGIPDTAGVSKDYMYRVYTKGSMCGAAYGVGICKHTENLDKAIELVSSIMFDKELANAILYGEDNYDAEDIGTGKMWYNLSISADNTEEEAIMGGGYDNIKATWDWQKENRLWGFMLDTDNVEELLSTQYKNMNVLSDLWTKENFGEEYINKCQNMKDTGIVELSDEITGQLNAFMQTGGVE